VEGAPHVRWTIKFTAALALLSLIGTAATYLVWFSELRRAPLVTLTTWTMLTPVFGVAFGWLLPGDGMTIQQTVGLALVLIALPLILLPAFRGKADRPSRAQSHPRALPLAAPKEGLHVR